ncbi:DnaB-like helicase N-terminal domain-containing protein [Actinomadura sp. J1-007]|uniref:DnaB-like helicase N-terminal domain-containing protein n=1 Tax=Actinomadura sp. J1-007 TaxID=2661913 RepID=UPI0028168475|nr:DnaB-like helicase N-terminal domain-containing protein [Actinomadura sp. J1-007]
MSVTELGPHEREFERTPPHDIAAEQGVLGGMLLSQDAIAEVIEVIRTADFYRPAHQIIFDAILDLYGRGDPADAVTISGELTKNGEISRVGGAPYLHTLISSVPTAANASYYAKIVHERSVLRKLVETGTRIVQMGYAADGADADEVLDRAQAEVFAIAEKRAGEDYVPLSEIMPGALDEIEAIGSRGGQMTGVPTGFADMDALTNGLHPGQMIVVAARPAMGKALKTDTPLATPTGWTTMGEVQVGDHLLGADGRPTRVVAATEVMYGRPCYEVEFSDGEVIVADAQHQWRTTTQPSQRPPSPPRTARGALPSTTDPRYHATRDLVTRDLVARELGMRDQALREQGGREQGTRGRGMREQGKRGQDIRKGGKRGQVARTWGLRERRVPAWGLRGRGMVAVAGPFVHADQAMRDLRSSFMRPRRPRTGTGLPLGLLGTQNVRRSERGMRKLGLLGHEPSQIGTAELILDQDRLVRLGLSSIGSYEPRPNQVGLLGRGTGHVAGSGLGPKRVESSGVGRETRHFNRVADGTSEVSQRSVKTTEEIAATLRVRGDGRPNHAVEVARPFVLPHADLPIDPYVLGAWLGGGTSDGGEITGLGTEIVAELEAAGEQVTPLGPGWYGLPGLARRLKDHGLLNDKHVPAIYLRASEDQRRALLAGLLDTGGRRSEAGQVWLAFGCERLAEGVRELLLSLGHQATMTATPGQVPAPGADPMPGPGTASELGAATGMVAGPGTDATLGAGAGVGTGLAVGAEVGRCLVSLCFIGLSSRGPRRGFGGTVRRRGGGLPGSRGRGCVTSWMCGGSRVCRCGACRSITTTTCTWRVVRAFRRTTRRSRSTSPGPRPSSMG